jgi:surface protein
MFRWNLTFNQNIGNWNTSNVTSMNGMLQYVSSFNQNINTKIVNEGLPNEYIAWDVSKVTTMAGMLETTSIQYSLNNWNTSNVTNMSYMCAYGSFNADISSWNTSKVTNMEGMFTGAYLFNQNIGAWNTSAVTSMSSMFNGATAFNQNIGAWNVSNVINFVAFMAGKTAANYSAANLDSIYNGWSSRPVKPNLNINFSSIKYTAAAQAGKDILDFAPNNWTIVDGGI